MIVLIDSGSSHDRSRCGVDEIVRNLRIVFLRETTVIGHLRLVELHDRLVEQLQRSSPTVVCRRPLSGETSATLHRYTAYFTSLAERVPTDLVGSDAAQWYARFEADIGNFQSALDQAVERGEP